MLMQKRQVSHERDQSSVWPVEGAVSDRFKLQTSSE